MSLLVGLPLKLFHLLFVVLRFAWPLLLAAVVWLLWRRHAGQSGEQDAPTFKGPVYTVDYKEVKDEGKED